MKEVFSIDIANHFPTERIIERLEWLEYKAKEEYGIALVSIWSDCPQKMVDVIVQDVLDEIINEEVA